MLDFENILRIAGRLRDAPEDLARGLAQELYRAILSSDPDAQARLLARAGAPPVERREQIWQRNNLQIPAPLPQRIIGKLPRVEALDAFLESAAAHQEVVKALGDGWGMSSAALSRDWLVPMADSFDAAAVAPDRTARVGGGARVATLNAALDRAGLSLTNAPGYDRLTFAGTTAMGGHGSGLGLGPLAEQVLSLELLTVDGNGQALRATFDRSDPLFPAVVTSLGALGIVTELTLQAEDAYFIEETRTLRRWVEVQAELPELFERQRRQELHSIEIWLNPYLVRGAVWCVLGTRRKTVGPAKGERGWAITHGDRARFDALCAFMRAFPDLIPLLLDAALSQTQASGVVLSSATGLDFGTTNLARVVASECSIDLAETIPTVEALVRGIQRLAAEDGRWVTSAIGLRFVAPGSAWLSPAHGRETCTIELPQLVCTPHARDTLAWFVREAVPHGRPHWGQWNPLTGAELRARYPRACTDQFLLAMQRLDPLGVFANDFVRDLRNAWGNGAPAFSSPRGVVRGASDCSQAEVRSYSRLFCDPTAPPRVPTGKHGILNVLQRAKTQGVKYTVRSAGHGLHTQAIRPSSSDGEYLFIDEGGRAPMNIDEQAMTITVPADATWHAIVHETLRRGLLPKVIVTAPEATIGGTLASNSIGQGCRRFGHEADTVESVTIAVPGDDGNAPALRTLRRPDPADTSEDAQLFRAVIRGYGLIGVIVEATYQLIRVPADPLLPSVEHCHGRGGPQVDGDRCVAVTDVEPFSQDRLGEALQRLAPPATGDDELYRACVLFKVGEEWTARVTTTRFETGRFEPHLVTYEGDTPARRVAELMLGTMPTAYVAGRIAAKVTENGKQGYRDPACGYLFTMLANDAYKKSLPKQVEAVVAPTVQMTYVLPEHAAVAFLLRSFQILRLEPAPVDRDALAQTIVGLMERPELVNYLFELYRETRQLANDYLGDNVLSMLLAPDVALSSLLAGVFTPGALIPALFEMVWIPADHHLLSASFDRAGIAISLAFQGPGTNRNGVLEALYPFSVIVEKLYGALEALSAAAIELGGAIHLTKNVFVPGDSKSFLASMLGPRLEQFRLLRSRFDAQRVLTNAFAEEVLGV